MWVVSTIGCGMEVMNSKLWVVGLSHASVPSGLSPLGSIISAMVGSLSVGESRYDWETVVVSGSGAGCSVSC